MHVLGEGFQKFDHCRQVDRHTGATENNHSPQRIVKMPRAISEISIKLWKIRFFFVRQHNASSGIFWSSHRKYL